MPRLVRRARDRWPWIIVAFCLPAFCAAEPSAWIDSIQAAYRTAKAIDGVALDTRLVLKDFAQRPTAYDIGLPAGAPLTALASDGGDVYLVTATMWQLGNDVVTPRDIVKIGGDGMLSIFRKGDAVGLPDNAHVDALSVRGGEVLISLNIHSEVGGLVVGPSDVLSIGSSSLAVLHRADELGIPASMDLATLDRAATGTLMASFDVAGEIAGLSVRPGDILEYHPSDDAWTLARSRERWGFPCSPCDLAALASQTSATTIFRGGLELHED